MTSAEPLVHMASITKVFPGPVVANDDISLAVYPQTVHAIIGENGAGKSTLMGVLYGRFRPDRGRIRLNGQDVSIGSPAAAISMGIGMVTQHTTLIPALTVLDNAILGAEPGTAGVLDRGGARERLQEIAAKLGISLDWNAPARTLSVAAMQKAEIVKALYRGAKILILDEPTATLAPQEADSLFAVLHSLVETGATVLFVTHKLREVLSHSDRVTVLRSGKLAGERLTSETYMEDLLALMLGHRTASPGVRLTRERPVEPSGTAPWERGPLSEMLAPPPLTPSPPTPNPNREGTKLTPAMPALEIKAARILNDRRAPAVRDLSLQVFPGEALGIAGVDGSGQRELAEAIAGLRSLVSGSVWLNGRDVTRLGVRGRMRRGLAYVPEDRQREGLIPELSIAENLLLGRQREPVFGGGAMLDLARVAAIGEATVSSYRIRAGGGDVAAGVLSGGNQQKVLLARALSSEPRLLIAMQPTRGLDVEATRFVYESLRGAQVQGLAILLFSLDLDEIFEISDRIAIIFNGTIAGILPRSEATPEMIGRLMLEGRA